MGISSARNKSGVIAELLNLAEYEAAAKLVLPQMAYDYYAGGADDEVTLRENLSSYDRWRIKPRMLMGIAERDLSVEVLGQQFSMPIGVAPMAYHKLAHPDGELATARAAGAAGALMCVSTAATYSIEEVAGVASAPLWFQLYFYKDRGLTESLVQWAQELGYKALVLTVDVPYLGRRERDIRNRFTLPPGVSMRNFEGGRAKLPADMAGSGLDDYISQQWEDNLSWEHVDWLVSISGMPVLVKGILSGEDARLAGEHGAAGVVVSNHGGRQLDSCVTALNVLPEIVAAVRDSNLAVLMDGGIRRGTDVVKALALGAQMVLVGRPVLWGLAVNGEAGAKNVLDLLRKEFDLALALTGCRKPHELNPNYLVKI